MAQNQLPTNSGNAILSALPQLLQLFVGSGTTTKGGTRTTSTSVAPNSNPTAVNALIDVLASDAANPNAANSVVSKAVQNSIQNMLLQGVPSIGSAERGAGIFNSSTTAQAMANLQGRAASEAAKIEVDQINKAAALRAQTAQGLNQMTAAPITTNTVNETDSSSTGPAIDPMMAGLGLVGAMGLNYLLKNRDTNSSIAGANVDVMPSIKPSGQSDLLNLDFKGVGSMDIPQFIGSAADQIASGLKDSISNSPTATGGWDEFTNVLQGVGTNLGITTALNAISGLFSGGSGSSSTDSGVSGGTVICTRMHELGYLSDDDYAIDKAYGNYIKATNPALFAWYHSWAIPFVTNYLHGNTLVSKSIIIATIVPVKLWSAWMKWQTAKLMASI